MHDFGRHLRRAFARLAASDTPIKRRNARKRVRGLLRRIERLMDREYPVLTKEGKARAIPKGPSPCPLCNRTFKSWLDFAAHMWRERQAGFGTASTNTPQGCWCGKKVKSMGAHFRRLRQQGEDPKMHLAKAALLEAAGRSAT